MEPPAAPLIDARNNKTWLKKKKKSPRSKIFYNQLPQLLILNYSSQRAGYKNIKPPATRSDPQPDCEHEEAAGWWGSTLRSWEPVSKGDERDTALQHYNTAHGMGFCSLKTNRLYLLPVKAALFITWHYWNSYCWRTIESSLFFSSFLIFNLFQGFFQKLQFKEASLQVYLKQNKYLNRTGKAQ